MTHTRQSWKISTERPVSYDISCCHDLLNPENKALLASNDKTDGKRRFVVVDTNVLSFYGDAIANYFKQNGITAYIHPFEAGEDNKSMPQYLDVLSALENFPINRRNEPIIAIGGGVTTDLVGFVASTWRRGVPHINVPTTLMGYVDAAIGIKTGINFNSNKNRLGCFSPPEQVLLDRSFFTSLPRRDILNGVGEILKLAVVKEPELFFMLERHGSDSINNQFQNSHCEDILNMSVTSMLAELEPNLFETDLARAVDFGHNFSPALEMQTELNLLHGEAVVIDILLSSIISFEKSILSKTDLDRIFSLTLNLGLPLSSHGLEADLLMQSLLERQHHRNGVQCFPVPTSIGACSFVEDITINDITSAVTFFQKWLQESTGLKERKSHEQHSQCR